MGPRSTVAALVLMLAAGAGVVVAQIDLLGAIGAGQNRNDGGKENGEICRKEKITRARSGNYFTLLHKLATVRSYESCNCTLQQINDVIISKNFEVLI